MEFNSYKPHRRAHMPKKKATNKSIFISSTFRDMQAERDALRDMVLPRVNEFAAKYGRVVELIDLRWGVDTTATSEAEQNHKVLRTCLDEIERSRPFFIGLLGDRYGWTPPRTDMEASLEEAVFSVDNLNMSVTALEIEYGVLRSVNPPICLFYFRNSPDYELIPEDQRQIYRGAGEDCSKLTQLKDEIRTHFPGYVKHYTAEVYEGGLMVSKEWAEMVAEDIQEKLRKEWGEPSETPPNWKEQEQELQVSFREGRTEHFAGRSTATAELTTYCLDESSKPQILMLQGEPGSGKTGLLCKVMEEIEDKCLLLPFVCGVSPRSTQVESMMRYFIATICARLNLEDDSDEITKFLDLKDRFFELLHAASNKMRVIIVVDALDQLARSDEAKRMLWISGRLPENVRIICSIIEGSEINAVKQLGGKVNSMPAISREDEASIIYGIATRQRKQIGSTVVAHILQKQTPTGAQAAQNPLYLSLITQDLVMMNRYELNTIQQYMEDGLSHPEALAKFMCQRIDETPGDPEGAYLAILNRLEKLIGPDFVRGVCGLIAVSRTGLREIDLQNAFTELGLEFNLADFAWLRQMLRGHISQGDKQQWDFSHQSLRRALWRDREAELLHLNKGLTNHLCKSFVEDEFVTREIMHHLCVGNRPDFAAQVMAFYGGGNAQALVEGISDIYTEHAEGEKFLLAVPNSVSSVKGERRWRIASIIHRGLPLFPECTSPFRIELMSKALAMLEGQEDEITIREVTLFHDTIADLYTKMGESEQAGRHYQKSLGLREKICGQSQNVDALRDLSISYGKMGDYLTSQGESEKAGAKYQKFLELREKLYAQSPTSSALRNLSESYLKMGDYLTSQGESEEAGVHYQKSLEAREKLYAQSQTASTLSDLSESYDRMGDYLNSQGKGEKAGTYYHKSLEAAEKLYAQKQTSSALRYLLVSYSKMGDYFSSKGEHERAGAHHLKSLEAAEKIYAQSQTAYALHDLTITYEKMGDYFNSQGESEKAGVYYQKSLEACEKLCAQSQTTSNLHSLSVSYTRMGDCLSSQGECEEAGVYYQKSLEAAEKLYAQTRTTFALYRLSVSYDRMGDYSSFLGESKEAGAYYQKSLDLREKLYAQSQTASALRELSVSYRKMGDYLTTQGESEEAGYYYRKFLEVAEKLYAQNPTTSTLRDLSVSQSKMGDYLTSQGMSKEAGAYYWNSLEAREKIYAQSQSNFALRDLSTSYINMGDNLSSQGESEKASVYYWKSLETDETLYAQNPTASALLELSISFDRVGDNLSSQGKNKEAGVYYQKSVSAREQLYTQRKTVKNLRNLMVAYVRMGHILTSQKEIGKATEYYQKSISAREQIYEQSQTKENLDELARSYDDMGKALATQGETAKALEYHQKFVAAREKMYEQSQTRENLYNLAIAYNNMCYTLTIGQVDTIQATEYYKRCVAVSERLYEQSQNTEALRYMYISFDRLGDISYAFALHNEAFEYRKKALETFEQYLALVPSAELYHSYYFNKVNRNNQEMPVQSKPKSSQGACRHCGGKLSVFKKKCKDCGVVN